MSTLTLETDAHIQQIGLTAGCVWKTLHEQGSLSLTKLTKQIDAPRDVVMQAVGWLAREEKISIEDKGRGRVIALH